MLPVLTLLADAYNGYELPVPAVWFGIIMFIVLMLSLLLTLSFTNKGRELPADPNAEH